MLSVGVIAICAVRWINGYAVGFATEKSCSSVTMGYYVFNCRRALLRNNFWQAVHTLVLSPSSIDTGVNTGKVAEGLVTKMSAAPVLEISMLPRLLRYHCYSTYSVIIRLICRAHASLSL